MRKLLSRLRARIQSFWDLEDPEERIEGTGEPYLDPAYNPQYTTERRIQESARAEQEADDTVRD